MRITEVIHFEQQGIVEVRSRPLWIVLLERWFVEVHELFSHTLKLRIPYEDPYWGEPMEAGFHKFYTWTLNHGERIDATYKVRS